MKTICAYIICVTLCKDNQVSTELQMEQWNIQLASPADEKELADLFRCATDAMIASGIHQWNYTYPLPVHFRKDLEMASCWVAYASGQIAGTITLDFNQDVQYKKVGWNVYDRKPLVVHRLAVHPQWQGKGLGQHLMHFAEGVARQRQVRSIRLDAFSQNPASNAIYYKLGYRRAAGYCFFHGIGIPFYCYDKALV